MTSGDDILPWRRRLLVPTLVLAGSLMAVVSSLGAPLIPSIARADGVSLSTGDWILTVTLMTGALATPVMGRLADGPRQREVILFALSSVVAGCILSALSGGFVEMIAGRAMQGVGLGLLPVAMAIARRNLPPDEARRTIATLSVTVALGAGLGYPLTGLVAQIFDFRGAYWLGAVMISAVLILAAVVLPASSGIASRRFDAIGTVALSLVIIGITVLLSEGAAWGWGSPRSLGTLAGSVILIGLWVHHELGFADPLVDLRQVKNRAVLTADSAAFLIGIAMYLFIPVLVEFVQIPRADGYGFGASILVSGLVLVPLSVATFVASRLLTSYEQRFGARTMVPLGSAVFGASAAFFAVEHSALWEAGVTLGISGLGLGFSSGAMPGFIVRAVPPSETGSAMGFYQVIRSIGLTVGSALGASVLKANTRPGKTLPDVNGFRVALLIAAGACAATLIVSYVLPGKAANRPLPLGDPERKELDQMLVEEAHVAGSGFILAEEPSPFGSEEHRG